MRRLSLPVIFSLFVIILCGCTSPIVGKWEGKQSRMSGTSLYKADNTFESTANIPALGTLNISGTYKLSGDQLTVTPTKVDAPSVPPVVMTQMRSRLNQPQIYTVKFPDGESMEQSVKGQAVMFNRVKEAK